MPKAWTIHDLRRTAVTHMAEIGVQPHVIESVVNHVSGHKGGIAGIYNRAEYATEKRTGLAAMGRPHRGAGGWAGVAEQRGGYAPMRSRQVADEPEVDGEEPSVDAARVVEIQRELGYSPRPSLRPSPATM